MHINYLYYSYIVSFQLFINLVVLVRWAQIKKRKRSLTVQLLLATVIHVCGLVPLIYYSEYAPLVVSNDCSALLPLQVAQIVWSVFPTVLLFATEISSLIAQHKQNRYFTDEQQQESLVYTHLNDLSEQIMSEITDRQIVGFSFQNGDVLTSDLQLTESELKRQRKCNRFLLKALRLVPAASSVLLVFVRTVLAAFMYQIPVYNEFFLAFNVITLVALGTYPLIISITPLTQPPQNIQQLLSTPIGLKYFREYLMQQSNPLILVSY